MSGASNLRVHSFGWAFSSDDLYDVTNTGLISRHGSYVDAFRGSKSVRIEEHARLSWIDAIPWKNTKNENIGRHAGEWLLKRVRSSITNPWLMEVTADMLGYLSREFHVHDLIVIGHCRGAGIARASAFPCMMQSRTIVVSGDLAFGARDWIAPEHRERYEMLGLAGMVARTELLSRLFSDEFNYCGRLPDKRASNRTRACL